MAIRKKLTDDPAYKQGLLDMYKKYDAADEWQKKKPVDNTPQPDWRDKLVNRLTSTRKPVTTNTTTPTRKKVDLNGTINDAIPYISNAANAFRKIPAPAAPQQIAPVTLSRVNMSGQRNEIGRQGRTADLEAERSGLDSNAVAAIKANNLATKIGGYNQVNSQEQMANTQIANQQAGMNASIGAQNVGINNDYQNTLLGLQIAKQRESSGNLANFADKYTASQNEKAKAQVDMDKFKIASDMFKQSGVMSRYLGNRQAAGDDDPTGIMKQFKVKNSLSSGGMMKRISKQIMYGVTI